MRRRPIKQAGIIVPATSDIPLVTVLHDYKAEVHHGIYVTLWAIVKLTSIAMSIV